MIQKYLNKMMQYTEAGYYEQALVLGNKMLEIFLDDKIVILLAIAEIKIRSGNQREALIDLVHAYQECFDPEIYETILNIYLMPYKEALRERYELNVEALSEYDYYINESESDQLQFCVLWMDNDILIGVDLSEKRLGIYERNKKIQMPKKGEIISVVNELWYDELFLIESTSRIEKFGYNKTPMYLLYDKYYWQLFLQKCDVLQLMETNRVIFLIGKNVVRNYFNRCAYQIPHINYLNGFQCEWEQLFQEIDGRLREEFQNNKKTAAKYYKQNKNTIVQRIITGKPKILFYTSRFTTVLQYHTRDCLSSAARLGCETRLLIEHDNLHLLTEGDMVKTLVDFKPDIVFCIDHFRFEYIDFLEELVWICWVQDLIGFVMDQETPSKLNRKDFVMNHFITWRDFFDVGYDDRCLIDAPIPANASIYKTYELTPLEIKQYGCDLCFVCHASDAEGYIKEKVEEAETRFGDMGDKIYTIYQGYRNFVYESAQCFYSKTEFLEYIYGVLYESFGVTVDASVANYYAKDMHVNFNQRVYREVLVDWLIDAGYKNIKLWGNGWTKNPKYADYAMGPAENGETLSKIYQASKIVIGNNVVTTAAARAWETMLSGGFYLSNYIPEEDDATDIRKIIEVGKDVIMFYGKDDLLEKIHYYLEHEEERQMMIERGRKAALENMTFDILMKRTLSEVAKRLEENDNG